MCLSVKKFGLSHRSMEQQELEQPLVPFQLEQPLELELRLLHHIHTVLAQEPLRIRKVLGLEPHNRKQACDIRFGQGGHEDASAIHHGMDQLELLQLSASYGRQFP